MQILPNAHIECIINGHRITGLAEEDRPYEFAAGEDLIETQVGADGGVYATSKPMFGGEFTIRLQPTSPSTQWFIRQKEAWKQSLINSTATVIYEGSYADPAQGRSARMEGGVLQKCPDINEPGQSFEVVLYFERIVVNVDGAIFLPILAQPDND